MARAARQHKTNRIKYAIIALVVLLAVAGGVVGAVIANSSSHKVGTTLNAQNQLADIKYNGQNGQTALVLLEKHADVTLKHYSFGDLVTSINGVPGNGPKYWSFYLNGKMAQVGAGSYVTKNSDKLEWKLQ
ncbi:MAG TPA: DUF4430 domain-containing protein [Candidatus Saccharimonadales bacterium]|nr:DUF4430 domain-containing protein [Candidatus Saccharimonadales bacterium]